MLRRRVFWFLNQTNNDPQFQQNILWIDEATFTREDILNQRNSELLENSHVLNKLENKLLILI